MRPRPTPSGATPVHPHGPEVEGPDARDEDSSPPRRPANAPDWLAEGEPVAVVGGHQPGVVVMRTVARFTKTRVVLDDGSWFPLDRLTKRFGGTWGHTMRLADPNDPAIVRDIRVAQIRTAVGRMFAIMRDMGNRPTDEQLEELTRLGETVAKKARP